ncbi:hypothetical protein ACFE04_012099 [Oxalis oulophora]
MFTESVNKITVCEKCGDKGRQKDLIFCGQCKTAAEHRYCLHVLPKKGKKVSWRCEVCCPTLPKPVPAPSRKSDRISRGVKRKMTRIERLKEERIPKKKHSVLIGKSTQIEPKKNKRRYIADEESDPDEEFQPIQDEHVQLPPPVLPSSQFDENFKIGPLGDAIWRGTFDILYVGDNKRSTKLYARVSSGACSLARNAAASLKPLLVIETMIKSLAWPKRFEELPPNGNDIELYFFPENESDDRMHKVRYNSVLVFIMKHEMILKTVSGDAELLLFHSSVLPPEFQRHEEEYYLWGMFSEKILSLPPDQILH